MPPKPYLGTLESLSQFPTWSKRALYYLEFERTKEPSSAILSALASQFSAYYRGENLEASDILLDLERAWGCCSYTGRSTGAFRWDGSGLHGGSQFGLVCCTNCEDLRRAIAALLSQDPRSTNGEVLIHRQVLNSKITTSTGNHLFQVTSVAASVHIEIQELYSTSANGYIPPMRIDLAWDWIKVCNTEHKCRKTNGSFTPQRLVHIGASQTEIRLVERKELQAHPEYAALSYVWGKAENMYSTKLTNLDEHRRALPFNSLPQTLQDAITLCSALGIHYLWVDALCIIQGDLEDRDWKEQCGEMATIYSNAYLTITADDSPESSAGFGQFHHRTFRYFKIPETPKLYGAWTKDVETPEMKPNVLSTRAWALQERILSHRILRFTSTGMEWECDWCCRQETGDRRPDLLTLAFRAFRLSSETQGHEILGHSGAYGDEERADITDVLVPGSWLSAYYAWDSIVQEYTNRQMTNLDDKLAAISGLASFFAQTRRIGPQEYLVGLWKGNLAEALLWYPACGHATPCRYHIYTAPSWSWASIQGPVEYFRERYQFTFDSNIEFVASESVLEPGDPFGRVSKAKLTLRAPIVEVDLIVNGFFSTSQYTGTNGHAGRAHANQSTWVSCITGLSRKEYEVLLDTELCHISPPGNKPTSSEPCIEEPPIRQPKYHCLSVGEMTDSITGGQRHWWLVLEEVDGPDEGVYRRIGLGYYQCLQRKFDLFDRAIYFQPTSPTITLI
ncbi:hypothetical protein OQA88_7456 [Cercophora sp. LCS_1]